MAALLVSGVVELDATVVSGTGWVCFNPDSIFQGMQHYTVLDATVVAGSVSMMLWCYGGCRFCFHDATVVAGPVFSLAGSASALTGSCRVFRTMSP